MAKQLFTPQVLDIDEFQDLEIIETISQGWEIRWTYIKTGTTEAKLWVFTTPRMQFSWVGYDNAIMIESSPPRGTVQLSFIKTDGLCNINHQKIQNYELLIVQSGEESNFLSHRSNAIFSIAFEYSFFHRIFYRYFEQELDQVRKNYRLTLHEQKLDHFIRKLQNYFYFFKSNQKEFTNAIFFAIEEEIIQELFDLVILSDEDHKVDEKHILKARKILEANVDNLYKISELIDSMDISGRTLQYSFKKELGLSPKQYLQYLRLSAVRKELLDKNNEEKNISDIIAKYGYFHPSAFTAAYKNFFGETPTQTLSKI